MNVHPDENLLFYYVSGEMPAELGPVLEQHIEECDVCFERLKSLLFIKQHFSHLWQTLSLAEIMDLEREMQDTLPSAGIHEVVTTLLAKKPRKTWNRTRSTFPLLTAAAAVFFVLAGYIFLNLFNAPKSYDQWFAAGIVKSGTSLDLPVGRAELDEMLSGLAGTKVYSTISLSSALKVKDGADAIANVFHLEQDDRRAIMKGIKGDAALTYRNALGLIDNFAGELYSNQTVKSGMHLNFAVNASGAVLKDMNIKGNLYLLQGIGEGEATLQNVRVSGRIYVLGGGMGSVIFENSTAANVVVYKENGKVRLYAKQGTVLSSVMLGSGAKLQAESMTSDAFRRVRATSAMPEGSELILDGKFPDILVNAARIHVNIENGLTSKLELGKNATGTQVDIARNSVVELLTINAPSTVRGSGLVKTAEIRSSGVQLDVRTNKVNHIGYTGKTGASVTNSTQPSEKTGSPVSSGEAKDDGIPVQSIISPAEGNDNASVPVNSPDTASTVQTGDTSNLNAVQDSNINISNNNIDKSIQNSNNTTNNEDHSTEITNSDNNSSTVSVLDMDAIKKQIDQQAKLKNKAMIDIQCTVLDSAGQNLIQGVVVFVNGQAYAITAANGAAVFSVYPNTIITVKVVKDGYVPYQMSKSYTSIVVEEFQLTER